MNLKLEELKNKNNLYSKKINKANKSNWKKLKIENNQVLFYNKENNDNNTYYKNKLKLDELKENSEQIDNIDLLMFLYNKSKQLEEEITNK